MKHRRQATGRRIATRDVPLVALVVLLGVSIGLGSMAVPGPRGAAAVPSSAAATVSARISVGAFSEAVPISPEFWGVNVAVAQRFNDTDAASVAATPVTYLRFPGGTLAEEYNYTTGVLTENNGTQIQATTSTPEFVKACHQMGCEAILQLPAEIDQPSTAAY
ncbi:MAG: hypothetical protein WA688_08290, partial [Thermoplasmata archaeon]